jgi:hypothetical protein
MHADIITHQVIPSRTGLWMNTVNDAEFLKEGIMPVVKHTLEGLSEEEATEVYKMAHVTFAADPEVYKEGLQHARENMRHPEVQPAKRNKNAVRDRKRAERRAARDLNQHATVSTTPVHGEQMQCTPPAPANGPLTDSSSGLSTGTTMSSKRSQSTDPSPHAPFGTANLAQGSLQQEAPDEAGDPIEAVMHVHLLHAADNFSTQCELVL